MSLFENDSNGNGEEVFFGAKFKKYKEGDKQYNHHYGEYILSLNEKDMAECDFYVPVPVSINQGHQLLYDLRMQTVKGYFSAVSKELGDGREIMQCVGVLEHDDFGGQILRSIIYFQGENVTNITVDCGYIDVNFDFSASITEVKPVKFSC